MKNKSYIDTYTTIYSVDLVVANTYTTLEQLKKLYKFSDDTELDEIITDNWATTCTATRKSDGKNILLVKYNANKEPKWVNKSYDLIDTCAHEATHCWLDICSLIGYHVDLDNQESTAYHIGYFTQCIYKTLTKK